MKTLRNALLLVLGLALFVWLIANPIADAIATAHLQHLRLRIVADTDLPGVVAAAHACRADIVAVLEGHGVRVSPEAAGQDGSLELVLTVHGYDRCGGVGSAGRELLENVELALCDPRGGKAAEGPDSCAPMWSRATPLARVPAGAALPVRDQARWLVARFFAEEHLPARPSVPVNPRHLGWR